MISIIICSRQNDVPQQLRTNIRQTIGNVEYEIIVIDNSQNQYSIFEAYNKGVSLSNYPLLLFMHDDIDYRTNDWGLKLMDHFKDPKVGCVGIGGTPYLAYTPGGWWGCGIAHLYLLQYVKNNEEPIILNWFPEGSSKQEVVVLDGVWICIRKEVFNFIRFDEKTFDGFHFYDLDITLQAYKAGYKNLCVNDILIHHTSIGNFNKNWIENALLFHNKWKALLPISIHQYSADQKSKMEHAVLKMWLDYHLQIESEKRTRIYKNALKILAGYKRGLFRPKTSFLAAVIFSKYCKNLLLRR